MIIDLDKLPQKQEQRMDAQYGSSAFYRGVPLQAIIAKYNPPSQADLVLLHFRNGMLVPLPFRDARAMSRLNPLLAVAMAPAAEGPFAERFPPINRRFEGFADIPQVMFSGNKLVVSERWHPDVPEAAREAFSPWGTTDSLYGLEFAESSAYYRQFYPGKDFGRGAELFRQSCQFCHGVRKVGASFGWDFAQPIELHTYRKNPERLYYHIRYRVEYRATLEQMPALKHITEEEAGHLWRWMRAVTTTPLPVYTPTR